MPVDNIYGGKVRVRVCGLLLSSDGLLLLKHAQLGPKGYLWAPPGGGVEFGINARDALKKEFLEETGLRVRVDDFLFVNEYRDTRYHAVELFFKVTQIGGHLKLGADPELPPDGQILLEALYFTEEKIGSMDPDTMHNIFRKKPDFEELMKMDGFFEFERL